jgi:archaeal type IV pilus assembly protein PilA
MFNILSWFKTSSRSDPAVSPVVGIMLMITITLILAAIISGMTGGIAKTQQKPPSLLMDVSLVNTSHYNSLDIAIVSISEAIPTRDLKFITEWRKENQLIRKSTDAGSPNITGWRYPVGISTNTTAVTMNSFGDYSLLPGTRMFANTTESLNALFSTIPPAGSNIKIQIVHIPSGSVIAEKELTVGEG